MGGVLAIHTDHSMEQALLSDFDLTGYSSFAQLDQSLPFLLEQHSKGMIDEKEMWSRFTEVTNIQVPSYEGSLWAKYFQPELDPNVSMLIEKIKSRGYKIVCATNTEEAHYSYHLSHNQYAQFDVVYASCLIKQVKPDKQFFHHILETERVTPEQTFFIDDYASNCLSASELGITTHVFTNAFALESDLIKIGIL